MCRDLFLLVLTVHCCFARPFGSDHQPVLEDDVVTVESLRRDVRQPTPVATEVEDMLNTKAATQNVPRTAEKNVAGKSDERGYYKTYGSDAEGEKGYLKETHSKGDHGYKSLDTFHKRDGDKYGFEKHIVYGKARDDKKSGYHAAGESPAGKNGDYVAADTKVDRRHVDVAGYHGGDDAGYPRYTAGDDGDHHADEYAGHFAGEEPSSSSYGHSESYSTGDADNGSYESYSSYSSDAAADGDQHH